MGIIEDALADFIVNHFEDRFEKVEELKDGIRDLKTEVNDLEEKLDRLPDGDGEDTGVSPVGKEETGQSRVSPGTLKSIRDRFDLTQKELAEQLDVSVTTVSNWERGESSPGRSTEQKLRDLES